MSLVERSLGDALAAYAKGRKVIVLRIGEDGKINSRFLSEFLEDAGCHYLVDVPAVENPDFKQAVADMVSGKDKEKQAPPPEAPEM